MRISIQIFSSLLLAASVAGASENSRFFKRQSNNTDYVLKKGPLDTPWTEKVGTDPWPEYPRPQMERSDWLNLNGVWQYQNVTGPALDVQERDPGAPPFGKDLGNPVLVPFCLESALSGVMGRKAIRSWYRRTFDIPTEWNPDNRVLLNFGAVDYETTVFVNGHNATKHTGGYWSFEIDITDFLYTNVTNELLVYVWDPTNLELDRIPNGKQVIDPQHIWYTPCSGIWQTVWLESAPAERITKVDLSADMDGVVNVTVHSSGNTPSLPYDFTIHALNSDATATAQGTTNEPFVFKIDGVELWSPETPNLYNVTIQMGHDTVETYLGFRTVSQGVIDGVPRPLLNGEFHFLFSTLDQGFWPDGIYSPPSLEAMKWDLELLKDTGFNMVRKHIKVEPALFYRACDEIGLMVMQDMPSMTHEFYSRDRDPDFLPASITAMDQYDIDIITQCQAQALNRDQVLLEHQAEFNRQLAILIEQHKSYPSIVSWVIYNEGWGQPRWLPVEYNLTAMVKSLDPTRLVNAVTGWHDHGAGDYHDNHHYSYPQCGTPWYSLDSSPYDPKRIGFQGEFGGLGHNISDENAWKVPRSINEVNRTYEINPTTDIWNMRAHKLFVELTEQVELYACSGAVYTQTTDVEGEVNGLVTYDRRLNRMDVEQWKSDIQGLYDAARKRVEGKEVQMGKTASAESVGSVPVISWGS
ncbi:glycoside hydrolase family 2 protein [Lentithecium fluviatile CBS 122367]|uniref:Glycoside hydrolase family 2 protein n=1 Tax=Lentithecium fluviatile CBS 122367 TaxID=1168545 RepID=A0A6G1IYD9_9PLEO|nr:glycoside hydrolase family 2 protein [Lentithecium fluviatile CBS 122367]